ncbi:MAG: hypothetical protein KGJ43_06805 [Acidobacteriota bacterium]|nr:hypothetical protein [Acidobacteriota bacterium]
MALRESAVPGRTLVPGAERAGAGRGRGALAALIGGGTEGNSLLTAFTGALLIVLLAALGVTIVQVRQLIAAHLFIGLLLLGPVALKLASTGYRFARYYAGSGVYRRKGPPATPLRLLAPVVVLSTIVVFASGVVLLAVGPQQIGSWKLIHKASFIVWLGATGVHVLAHLPETVSALRTRDGLRAQLTGRADGAAGRRLALAGACVAGLVLALLLMGHFGVWTAPGAFPHHEH